MLRTTLRVLLVILLASSCASGAPNSMFAHVPENNPKLRFRIDSFAVPESSRPEFEAAMRRNLAFIETLPGFLGHVVYEKTGGPTSFNIVTVATWESQEALDRAGERVRAHYKEIGFDLPAAMARWGVKAELGNFGALQF